MMTPKAEPQHEWLKKFVGTWSVESECIMEPGKPPMTMRAAETTRMLGDYWLLSEMIGDMPGGGSMTAMMVVGYDPMKKKFVGTWYCDVMTTLFAYEGDLSADGTTLPLNTTGPNPMDPTQMATFQDVLEIHPDGRRLMWSQMLGPDGTWTRFMTARYTRVT